MERAEGVDTHNNGTPRVLFHRQCLNTITPLNPHINMAGVLYGTHLCLTLFVFSLSQQILREICMFTFASVAMNSKHSRECFVSGMIWTTTFGLSWLRNVRQSSTCVEVKTKLQHGQNKGVKHC